MSTSAEILADLKTCVRCELELPRSEFYRHSKSADRLQYHCKNCGRELQAEYARKRGVPQKRLRTDADEELLLAGFKVCFECDLPLPLSEFSPTARGWAALSAYCKPCLSKRATSDPIKHANAVYAWREANPEAWRIQHVVEMQRRRARKKELDSGLVTVEFIGSIYAQTICVYCDEYIDRQDRTVDHVIPLSRGGLHHPDNLVMACLSCNCRKHAKSVDEFLAIS